MSNPFKETPRECTYCGELFESWKDKRGDLFTEICKPCNEKED